MFNLLKRKLELHIIKEGQNDKHWVKELNDKQIILENKTKLANYKQLSSSEVMQENCTSQKRGSS